VEASAIGVAIANVAMLLLVVCVLLILYHLAMRHLQREYRAAMDAFAISEQRALDLVRSDFSNLRHVLVEEIDSLFKHTDMRQVQIHDSVANLQDIVHSDIERTKEVQQQVQRMESKIVDHRSPKESSG
jgi:hypothetical protein